MDSSLPDEVIKHWLLNAAVEFEIPLTYIFPEVSQALNVKPIPGCGSDGYASGLVELFDAGMIELSSEVEGDDTRTRTGVLQILNRFRMLSKDDATLRGDGRLLKSYQLRRRPRMQVSFRLTALGGEAWERIAQPDWARYVSVSTVSTSGDLISANRDLLVAYMGWYPEVNGEQIQLKTLGWQTHTNFEIVYWRRLPFVYHASFEVQPAKARWVSEEPNWFRDWLVSTCTWYKKPWSLLNWPTA